MHLHPPAFPDARSRFGLRQIFCALALIAVSGCGKTETAQIESPDVSTKLPDLVARARKTLVLVQGGSFEMGDFGHKHNEERLPYSGRADDGPLHKVTLDSFSISAYKTTFADYDVYTQVTGKPKIAMGRLDRQFRDIPGSPAGVSWQGARDYCVWLGQQLGIPMDLPTEAQWEYAARNRGEYRVYPTDNGQLDDGRNVASFDQRKAYAKKHKLFSSAVPAAVGQFPPNPLGLYDLVTDGMEWTLDWYDENYYSASPERNPSGPSSGTQKVLRGYSVSEGVTLGFLSMTFTRQHSDPQLPPLLDSDDRPIDIDPHTDTTFRCVANLSTPVPK
ncbi:formylglycine-generating enzyme family protein [Aquabacterium sp. A7-Y]|uniref:formylglycine-generating enzyme family protein n=1 Tax=Aquabacterium sp. A7-Y TaxID=1349605 RepID=UPI00223E5541|nr:SUMF1/EgtB/PvdO family nonheme iron enzyme [Aquabacterium sp. A7-Y]MCW7538460.1 formylglycine-generating enzyme family protein [Aquabacterium sp. A7-Y]